MTESKKKTILMIDNYDSFTYNLVHYLGELGQQVEVRRNDCLDFDFVDDLDPDMIVVSPGPCTPKEAGLSVDIIKRYVGKKPILGVCLGHQAVGYAYGANIVRAEGFYTEKPPRLSMTENPFLRIFQILLKPRDTTRFSLKRNLFRPNSRFPLGPRKVKSWG